jgi:hypothetical protein
MTQLALAMSLFAAVASAQTLPPPPPEYGVTEISDYRLDAEVLTQFSHASHGIVTAMNADARFERAPLFTSEILLSDDVLTAAIALETRLRSEPALAVALHDANLTPHEYTKFALGLVAARLAYGFVKSGVLRSVPPGVHADNVMFVDANLAGIQAVLKELGIDTPP